MKCTYTAAIIAAILVTAGAPAVKAQVAGIPYSFYGVLHVSAEYQDDGKNGEAYLSSNASRFGVKGESRLEDQLKAIWQIETTINVDESGGQFATRNTFVGVDSSYGKLIAGRHDSPLKILGRTVDLFGDQIGDSRNIMGIYGSGDDLRMDNMVMYSSPEYRGFAVNGAYAFGDADDQLNVMSGSVVLEDKDKGITAGLACEQYGRMLTPVDNDGDGEAESPSDDNQTGIRAGAAYTWREFTLTGLYQLVLNVHGGDKEQNTWGTGLSYKYGDHIFKGQYYGTGGGETDTGSGMFALGYDFDITRQCKAYVAYAATSNDDSANYRMSGGAHGDKITPAAGDDPYGVAMGFCYKF